MTPARAASLLRMVALQDTLENARKFRAKLAGEELTAEVYAALRAKIDELAKKEGKV